MDPGLAKTGWGVIRTGAAMAYVDSGLFTTPAHCPHIDRLRMIGDALGAVLADHAPALIAVERVFISQNLSNSLSLGEARGAALMTLLQAQVPIVEISALQIKQSVTGAGRANKLRVAQMVGRLLNRSVDGMAHDCTDALACALTAAMVRASPLPLNRRRKRRRFTAAFVKRLQ